ncbi:ribonuclease P protein component [Lactobacillus sp. ESL0684]|uniref:ribonuclease P protein component n=1 Tax=Lactobacillus sp. ESL0684 TaxID=2983213 RepID=UPI0023F81479|nr:ribonuclease P protein component [Lactobacillus sp. ESL0684]WEV43663.1 ribonuclease P protein component [Lactobacillus sp. ESL0684]
MRKSYRVKTENDFQRVFKAGNSVANRAFVIYQIDRMENQHFRVGISVGKKVAHTAVVRNRLKRYIRAVISENKTAIEPKIDFLVIARPYARNFKKADVQKHLLHVLYLANIIEEIPSENEED